MAETLLLIDAYALIYRAFYAIRELTGPQGQPVNAIFGFTKMLKKLVADHQPTHLAVVFDLGAPRQRLDLLPSYKEHRPPTPPALDAQLPAIRDVLQALGMPVVELEGEEADDIIATLARRAAPAGARVLIASTDKDLLQLVTDGIRIVRPDSTGASLVDAAAVEARYGVKPEQVVDLLCLTGDAVDNIPGVPGIGEKTAAALLQQFGSLDNLLGRLADVQKPRLREALTAHRDRLRQNRQLVELRSALTLPVDWSDLKLQPPDSDRLAHLYRQFGFKSLLAELQPAAPATGDLFGGR